MKVVVLDSNIWDKLDVDELARESIRLLVKNDQLEVLVPDTLLRDLEASQFDGVPDWFPTSVVADGVFVLDHSRLGCARLGDGSVYEDHKGESRQVSDAVIVATVDAEADLFVSEDRRARNRYTRLRGEGRSLDYQRFRSDVLGL